MLNQNSMKNEKYLVVLCICCVCDDRMTYVLYGSSW